MPSGCCIKASRHRGTPAGARRAREENGGPKQELAGGRMRPGRSVIHLRAGLNIISSCFQPDFGHPGEATSHHPHQSRLAPPAHRDQDWQRWAGPGGPNGKTQQRSDGVRMSLSKGWWTWSALQQISLINFFGPCSVSTGCSCVLKGASPKMRPERGFEPKLPQLGWGITMPPPTASPSLGSSIPQERGVTSLWSLQGQTGCVGSC